MQFPNGRKILGLLALVLVLTSGLYGGYWVMLANSLESQFETWVDHQRSEGIKIEHQGLTRSGFPGTLKFILAKPAVKTLLWAWQGDDVVLTVKPWALNTFKIDLSGKHKGVAVINSRPEPYTFAADRLITTIKLKNGYAHDVKSKGDGLSVHYGAQNDTVTLSEHLIEINRGTDNLIDWSFRFRDIRIPPALRAPLGNRIHHFDAKGQLDGPIVGNGFHEALSFWRDQGGKVDVSSVDVDYSPLRISGNGTIALDTEMQPIGAFTIQAKGYMDSIDRLVEAGMIKGINSLATKLMLITLTKKSPNGGERYLELPLTLQERSLTAGPFEIAKFRPIHW